MIDREFLARCKIHPLFISAFSGFCCSAWMAGTAKNLGESGEIRMAGYVLLLFVASLLANAPVALYLAAKGRFSVVAAVRVSLALSILFGSCALMLMHSRGVLEKGGGVADYDWPPIVSQAAAFLLIALLAAGIAVTFVPAVRRRMEGTHKTSPSTQS